MQESTRFQIVNTNLTISKIMTAYIAISFSRRKFMDKEMAAITDTLKEFKIAPFVFVDTYKFDLTQEHQMMQQAMAHLDHCDILLAETSEKGIGIGIEAGYAKAKGKPVIYLRQQDAAHSSTVSGISDFQVIYLDTSDLRKKLAAILGDLVK